MHTDTWHYPRPRLAEDYLATFARGLTSARGLFARRRMGKTEFLEKDLMPVARAAGYQTAYVNLWDNRENPALALVTALYTAAEPKGYSKLLAKLNQPVKKVKASGALAGLGKVSMEAEMGEAEKLPTGTLLAEALRVLDVKKKPMLLIIDEAQVLAIPENSNFAHALRSTLDVRKDFIKVVFAGSSESTLRTMFGRSSEPFYNWAALEPFQLLDRSFVEAMVKKVNQLSRFPLDVLDALAAFKALNDTPEFFRRYLERYLTHAMDGSSNALDDTKKHVFNSDAFVNLWTELLPVDQLVLNLVATGEGDIYGRPARERLGRELGMPELTKSTIQNSIGRLSKKNVVTPVGKGVYQFEDPVFPVWILERNQDA